MAGNYGIDQELIVKRLSLTRVIETTDDSNQAIDTEVLDMKIVEAEAELHLNVAPYYVTPLRTEDDEVPEGIAGILLESIAYRLMCRRPEYLRDEAEGRVWSKVRKSLDDWFADVSNPDSSRRKPIPGAVPLSLSASSTRGAANVQTDALRFSLEALKGFMS